MGHDPIADDDQTDIASMHERELRHIATVLLSLFVIISLVAAFIPIPHLDIPAEFNSFGGRLIFATVMSIALVMTSPIWIILIGPILFIVALIGALVVEVWRTIRKVHPSP